MEHRFSKAAVLAFLLPLLAACAAGGGDGGGVRVWAGEDSNGIYRVLELHPDGSFGDEREGSAARGTWRREGDGLAMETGKGYLRYEARVVDGRLVGRAWQPEGPWKVTFDYAPAPACAGERVLCGGQALCIDPERKRSLHPIPALTANPKLRANFDLFYGAFQCAVRLGLEEDYKENIAFPLTLRTVSDDPAAKAQYHLLGDKLVQTRQVSRRDFAPRDIAGDPGRPAGGQVPQGMTATPGTSMLVHWEYGSSLWTFRPRDGRWKLAESASCSGDTCPGAMYCGDPGAPPRYPAAGAGGEDFNAFFRAFYCAAKAGNKAMLAERVVFPFPYRTADTEGEKSGRADRARFGRMALFTGDGAEMPPAIRVDGDRARIDMDWYGTGMGVGLDFKRIGGKWHMVRGDFAAY